MKNDQQDDEAAPQIPSKQEHIGPNFISDHEEDELEPEAEQIQAS